MQYIHFGNLQMIIEDFNEIDQKNNISSLQQLIEVVIESSKRIELIQSDQLQEIKQVQVQGFKWILNLFKQYDQYRKNLIELIFQIQEEQIEYSRTIQISNYEKFIIINRFSHLFFIQINILEIILSSFKIFIRKVIEKIDVIGGEKPLNFLQFDLDNTEKILKFNQNKISQIQLWLYYYFKVIKRLKMQIFNFHLQINSRNSRIKNKNNQWKFKPKCSKQFIDQKINQRCFFVKLSLPILDELKHLQMKNQIGQFLQNYKRNGSQIIWKKDKIFHFQQIYKIIQVSLIQYYQIKV
ncbi:unnamed protein product [Paramecium sonneborni]|uniref:Uncharacterized protein n=1 Tax=Paramecium sonneborni TaxID=65129 RepID=A0A8S1NRU4_9CILI|nr:unnamed protein product [Paramecium sonneborni]